MGKHGLVFAALWLACGLKTASADIGQCGLEAKSGTVVEVAVSGDALVLDDARVLTVAGLRPPQFPRYGGAHVNADTVLRAAIANMVLGKRAMIRLAKLTADRYGRHAALIDIGDTNTSLQRRLVELGLAAVDTSAEGAECVRTLLAIEEKARRQAAGFWGSGLLAVRDADSSLRRMTGSFQIVQGVVEEVTQARSGVMLRFGGGERGFKAFIGAKQSRLFASVIRPETLRGTSVRVRGWIVQRDGPAIMLDRPEQIEMDDQGF